MWDKNQIQNNIMKENAHALCFVYNFWLIFVFIWCAVFVCTCVLYYKYIVYSIMLIIFCVFIICIFNLMAERTDYLLLFAQKI